MNPRLGGPGHRKHDRPSRPSAGRHSADPSLLDVLSRRGFTRRWVTVTSVVAASVLVVPAAMALSHPAGSSAPQEAAAAHMNLYVNLVHNHGFEHGLAGWRTNRQTQSLSRVSPGAGGRHAVKLTNSVRGNVILNDARNTVTDTAGGQPYRAVALVRSTHSRVSGAIVIHETVGARVTSQAQTAFYAGTKWQKVALDYVSSSDGAQIDLNVIGWNVPTGRGLVVDRVRLKRRPAPKPNPSPSPTPTTPVTSAPTTTTPVTSPPTTTTEPTTPVTSTPPVTSPPSTSVPTTSAPTTPSTPPSTSPAPPTCVANAMGIPAAGSAYLGAAVSGTSSLPTRETQVAETLPIHRTYYSANQVDYAVSRSQDDIAHDRVPWISFKLPYSWADMAAGRGDAWTAGLVDKLAKLNGPVWLAFHHEPVGDGPIQDWVAMQRHLSPIVHNRSDNVAFTLIYNGWDAVLGNNPAYWIANSWPGDQYVDLLGFDMYNNYGVVRDGVMGTTMLDPMRYFGPVSQFARDHGVPWGLGEVGYAKAASDLDPEWLVTTYHKMLASGGVGMSYFDSSLNSVADWTLDDPVKLDRYKRILPESTRFC